MNYFTHEDEGPKAHVFIFSDDEIQILEALQRTVDTAAGNDECTNKFLLYFWTVLARANLEGKYSCRAMSTLQGRILANSIRVDKV